jgi:hypothetical protein
VLWDTWFKTAVKIGSSTFSGAEDLFHLAEQSFKKWFMEQRMLSLIAFLNACLYHTGVIFLHPKSRRQEEFDFQKWKD